MPSSLTLPSRDTRLQGPCALATVFALSMGMQVSAYAGGMANLPDNAAGPVARVQGVHLPQEQPAGAHEKASRLVFIDGGLPDFQQIADAAADDAIVVTLRPGEDAVAQMAAVARGLHGLSSISIVSHGDRGVVSFGSSKLDTGHLHAYRKELAQIGDALAPGGGILLYGCSVGEGAIGHDYLEALARATGAVVAASTNTTGSAALGGDWTLEVSTAALSTPPAFDLAKLARYSHTLPQPAYSNATGYIGEQFFTVVMSVALDTTHLPPASAFDVQVNGTGVSVTGVAAGDSADSVKISLNASLLPGDIIDFVYTDPTPGNDTNALQGTDGTDAASFSHSIVVAITRPGPSAPATPTLDSASDTGQAGDGITSVNTPTISGTAQANATVKLYDTDGTTLLGTAIANSSGNWSITSSVLADGSHTLKVTQTDGSNTTSPLSSGLTVKIDTTAPAAPTSLGVTSGSDSGVSASDGISNVATPVITGSAEPGATVSLYDTDGVTLLGTAVANATTGSWSITSSMLADGTHTLRARQRDAAGNVSVASTSIAYTLDTAAPSGVGLSPTTIFVSAATQSATIGTLSASDSHSVSFALGVGNGTNDADNGRFTVSGGTLKVGATALSAGSYHVYLSATDVAGNVSYNAVTITVLANAAPVASNVSFTGTAQVGRQLSGTYTYTDADQDAQGTSTYRWVRNSVNTGIAGGTNAASTQNYTLGSSDEGKYLYFCVVPVALTGTGTGAEVCSSPSSLVVAAPVDGACGSAASIPASLLPAANLCTAGNASTVTTGANQYAWTCAGTQGGSNASCTAPWSNTATGQAQGALSTPAPGANNNWVLASAGFSNPPAPPPARASLPYGLANFTLTSGTPGSSASVTINYTSAIPAGAVYMKYGKSPEGYNCSGAACAADHWYQLPSSQVAFAQDRKSITLTIADGAVGDDDLSPNSVIVDPGGPAVLSADATPIPTLSEWGLLALGGLVAAFAFGAVPRRRRTH